MRAAAANPFIPAIPLLTVPQRDRRERFKLAVFCVLAAHLVLLLALLVQGYHSEGLTITIPPADTKVPSLSPSGRELTPPLAQTHTPAAAAALPNSATAASPALAQPVPVAQDAQSTILAVAESFHIVKSGDTLHRLARTYGTTVAALKTANCMNSERLAVGTKLRLPGNR